MLSRDQRLVSATCRKHHLKQKMNFSIFTENFKNKLSTSVSECSLKLLYKGWICGKANCS